MKQHELKKVFTLVFVISIVFFLILFWQKAPETDVPSFSPSRIRFDALEKPFTEPTWTWVCDRKRCLRRIIEPGKTPVSLATCSMTCGSTQLWPQPTGPITLGSMSSTMLHNQIYFITPSLQPKTATFLNEAILIFKEYVQSMVERQNYTQFAPEINNLTITINIEDGSVAKLLLNTDESYRLQLKSRDNFIWGTITANNFFGARHALETLSQLIWWDSYTNHGALRILRGASIQDAPVFAYRGLMLDTARNYMPVDSLKRTLVGMAATKLNVFHWHITDSQSFPLKLNSLPKLAMTGAYAPDMIYTPEDVKELVNFALVRGIRIIMEVDTPAHSGNGWTWGLSENLGELALCVNQQPWKLYCGEPPCGQLNPDNPKVYDVLEKLYTEILELTDEREIFHIGGDEVNLECWQAHLSKETLVKYVDLHDLWGEFVEKAIARLTKANKGPIPHILVWSSNLSKHPYLKRYFNQTQIAFQSWGASDWHESADMANSGYKVVISHVDAWYLDCGFGRWTESLNAACDPYRPWQTFYSHKPWGIHSLAKKSVMGAEACLWTEEVDDHSLDGRLWPRAAAFAERMWSDPKLTDHISEDVYRRLAIHGDRLVVKGLRPEILFPHWCKQNPGECNM